MSLNLDNFKDALVGAYKEVMDDKHPTDWAMFGYDGQTFDLKLVSKGDGGLDELVEDFNSGKIMYGLCRVKVKEKNLEKIALINWQGEGAPLARKGTCANHVGTIKNFFKGVHVTINARTDEDVTPDVIVAAVAKATSGEGLRMSSNFEAEGKVEPIGSCYKRVNPQAEINSKAKDDFWRKEEQEEDRRKREEMNKVRKFSQNEVKLLRRESQDYFHEQEEADQLAVVNSKSPSVSPNFHGGITNGNGFTNGGPRTPDSQTPQSNSLTSEDMRSISPTLTFSNSYIANEKAAALKASIPKRNSGSENLVRQRIKSFDGSSGVSVPVNTRNGNGIQKIEQESEKLSVLRRKQMFENGGASNTTNNFVRKNPAQEILSLQEESRKKAQAENHNNLAPPVKNSNPRTPTPETLPQRTPSPAVQQREDPRTPSPVRMASPVPAPVLVTSPTPAPVRLASPTPAPVPAVSPTPAPIKSYNLPFHVGGSVSGKLADTINKNSGTMDSRIETREESPPIQEDTTVRSGEVPDMVGSVDVDVEPATIISHDGKASPMASITSEMGLCARALYDYEAADDSEITFDPGEIITNIERIDEGWWEGMGPRGVYGLFPANYVELLN